MPISKRAPVVRRLLQRAATHAAPYFAERLEFRRLLALTGDFIADQLYTAADIDALAAQIRLGTNAVSFDLNSDGLVNRSDEKFLVEQIIGTKIGDTDLDGDVDSTDSARIQANFGQINVGWAQGDLDASNKIDFGDLSLLAPNNGQTVIGGPALANNAARLSVGLDSMNGAIDDWARLFNLSPIAGKTLPGVDDALSDVAGLVNATINTAPSFPNPSGVVSTLQTRLAALGFSLITLPSTTGQSDITVRLVKNFNALVGAREFDDGTNPLLSGLSAALNLSGSITHSVDLAVSLMLGVDSAGFFLRGDSTLTATVRGDGAVTGSYALPILSLGLNLTGTLDADFNIAFTAGTPTSKIRTAQLVSNAWTRTQSGQGIVDLNLTLTRNGTPTTLAFGGNWSIPVTSAGIGAITGGVVAPAVDDFVEAVLPMISDGANHYLTDALSNQFDATSFPMITGQIAVDNRFGSTRATDDRTLFDALLGTTRATLDFTDVDENQGANKTDANRYLHVVDLRKATNLDGTGQKIGVISNGVHNIAQAIAVGNQNLPAYLLGTDGNGHAFINPEMLDVDAGGKPLAEGIAMMEIIHDMAPGATLYFSGTRMVDPAGRSAEEEFLEAVDYLINAGCNIIVDDMQYLNEPRLRDGSLAVAVQARIDAQAAAGRDFLFVTAAGNHDQLIHNDTYNAIEGVDVDPDPAVTDLRRLHQFQAPGQLDATSVLISPNRDASTSSIDLEWDRDLTGGGQMRLLLIDDGTGEVFLESEPVAGLTRRQRLFVPEPKITANLVAKAGYSGRWRIAIESTAPISQFTHFSLLFSDSSFDVPDSWKRNSHVLGAYGKPSGGAYSHPALNSVLSVGAADEPSLPGLSPYQIAAYSVRGPSIVNFESRQIPHLVGIDGNDVSGVGPFDKTFDGTSSTAPQAAAIAALLKQGFPGVDFDQIKQAMMLSATSIAGGTGGVWNPNSGFGLMNAFAAAQRLAGGTKGSPFTPGTSSTRVPRVGPRGLALAQARGLTVVDGVSASEVLSLIGGTLPSTDLFVLRFNPDLPVISGHAQFNPAGVGSLGVSSTFGGTVQVGFDPAIDMTFGLDAQGFFLNRTSSVGGTLSINGNVFGRIGGVAVEAAPSVSLPITVGYSSVSANAKLRIGEVLNVANLAVSIGTITANLQVDLLLGQLDYVDNNPTVPNGPHGGDPFTVRATAALTASQQSPSNPWAYTFSFSPIHIANPNFNGGTYTFANFLTNLYRYGQDQLAGSGYLGQLLDALDQVVQPLSNQFKIGDEINEDLIQLVLNASSVQLIAPTSDVQFFNGLETWLQSGGTTNFEIIKARATITNLDLVELLTVGGELGAILRNGNQPINLSNALLSGSMTFGIDTAGGLFVDRGGGTNLSVGIQVDANLSSQKLLGPVGDLLALDAGSHLTTTTTAHVVLNGTGKLRLPDLVRPISNVGTSVDNVIATLTIPGADLLPRTGSTGFNGRVEGIVGTAVFNGSGLDQLTLNATSTRFNLFNDELRLQSGAVTISWDPQGTSAQTLLSIPSITATFPKRPTMPTGTLSNLQMTGNAITLGSLSITGSDFVLGPTGAPILDVRGPSFTLSNVSIGIGIGAVTAVGKVGVSASSLALFPIVATPALDGLVTVTNPTLTLDSNGLRFTATNATASIGALGTITAQAAGTSLITFNPDATGSQEIAALPTITATLTALPIDGRIPTLTVIDLRLKANQTWSIGGATINFLSRVGEPTFSLAEFIPFRLDSIGINFQGAPGAQRLDLFDLTINGQIDIARLSTMFGFTPIIEIQTSSGTTTHSGASNGALSLRIAPASIASKHYGIVGLQRVRVGFTDLNVSLFKMQGELLLQNFNSNGVPTGISGSLGFQTAAGSVKPITAADADAFDDGRGSTQNNGNSFGVENASLSFVGTINTASSANAVVSLAVDTDVGVRFKLADFFELYGVRFGMDFGFTIPTGSSAFSPSVNIGLRSMGLRKVRANLGPAGDPLVQFTGGSAGADFISLNFTGAGDIAAFGPLSVTLPGLGGLGGTVTDLRILHSGFPNLVPSPQAPSAQFVFTPGNIASFFDFDPDGPGPQQGNAEKLFSWIPLRVDALGFQLQPAMFTFDGSGNITGVNDLAAFDFIFSGGLKDSIVVNGATIPFPIHGQVDSLKLDIAAMRDLLLNPTSGKNPFKDISGVSIGIDPFAFAPDSPFKIKGNLGFGQLDTDNNGTKETIFIRVGGEFKYADFGGGAELIISNRGPLLAKVNVPLAIPLGPTGLMVSGVSGGVAFGIDTFFTPSDPMELVRNPVFTRAFDVSDAGIKAALAALPPGQLTWSRGLTVQLAGQISTVVPGVIGGNVSLLANVSATAAGTEAFLFGSGNITTWGMPLGAAGILVSLGDPLNPRYQMAMEAPAVGNPLGFILPSRGEFAYDLNPKGVLEAPITVLDSFINTMATAELNTLAARLEQDRVKNLPTTVLPLNGSLDFSSRLKELTRFVLDVNGDGTVSAAEFAAPITGTLLKNRIRSLLPDNFGQLPTGNALKSAANIATAFINDYVNLILGPQSNPTAALTSFLTNLSNSVGTAIQTGWAGFDPTLTVQGVIQPTIFGFPMGNPSQEATVSINKAGVSFHIGGSLTKMAKDILSQSTFGAGGPLLTLMTLGLEDNLSFGFRLDLSPIGNLITQGLATGRDTSTGGTFLSLLSNAINPFANWEVDIGGGISWMGFQLAQVDGLVFGADLPRAGWDPNLPVSATNHPDPKAGSLFEQLVRYHNRSLNAADLTAANDDSTHIPIYGTAPESQPYLDPRWTGMLREGGILLSARLFLPSLLTDPLAVFNSIKWNQIPAINGSNIPQTADLFIKWLDDTIRTITADDEFARLQMFLPSPARLFDLSTYQSTKPWLGNYSGDQSITKVNGTYAQETFTDSNGNGRYDFGEPFVDLPNGTYDLGETFNDLGNGRWDNAEPFDDLNANGVRDTNEKFTDLNRNGAWDLAEAKVVNPTTGVITSFTDRGNGKWDDAETFTDANNDGIYQLGERFDDFNNNGVRDVAETFVDAGNGTYDGASGTSPTRLPRKSQSGIDAVIGQIVGSAFVDGYLDLELLGFTLGRASLSIDTRGLKLDAEAPWLGLSVSTIVRNSSVDLQDLVNTFTSSPLLNVALNNLPGLQTALSAPWMPDIDLPIPVAALEALFGSTQIASFIQQNLGIPARILNGFGTANAAIGIYTPGFAAPGSVPADETVKVNGGLFAQVNANINGVLEGVVGKLAIELPSTRQLLQSPTMLLPDFVLSATATRFAAGLGDLSLIKIRGAGGSGNFGITLQRSGALTNLTAGGQILFLPDTANSAAAILTASTNLNVDTNPTNGGIFGRMEVTTSAPINLPPFFKFSSQASTSQAPRFALNVNTTSVPKPIALPGFNNNLPRTLNPGTLDVSASGQVSVGNIFFIGGTFDLSIDAVNASFRADATGLNVRVTAGSAAGAPDLYSVTADLGLLMSRTGVALRGSVASSLATPVGPTGIGFGTASNLLIELNSYSTSKTVGGGTIAGNTKQLSFGSSIVLGMFALSGQFTIKTTNDTTTTLVVSAAGQNIPVLGTFTANGSMTVAAGGIEASLALTRASNDSAFGLSGTFSFFIDTLDDPISPGIDPDVFKINATGTSFTVLGIALPIPNIRITGNTTTGLFTLEVDAAGTTPGSAANILPFASVPTASFPSISFNYRLLIDSAGQFRIDGGTNGSYATATFAGWGIGDANIARLSLNSVGLQVVRQAGSSVIRGRLKGNGSLLLPVIGQSYSLNSWLSFGDDFNFAAEATGINGTTGNFSVYVDLERDIFSQLFDGSIWSRSNIAQSWAEMTALDSGTQQPDPKRLDISSGFVGGGTWTNDSPDLGKYAFVAGQQQIDIPEQNDSLTLRATGLTTGQSITVSYAITFPASALINQANRADLASSLTGSFVLTSATPTRSFSTILNDRYFEFNEDALITFTYSVSGFTLSSLIRPTSSIDYTIINSDPELDRSLAYWEFDTGTNATGGFTKTPTFVGSPDIEVSDWKHASENAFTPTPGTPGAPGGPRALDFESTDTDYVDFGTTGITYSAADTMTVEAWIRIESFNTNQFNTVLAIGPMSLFVSGTGTSGDVGVQVTPSSGATVTQFIGVISTGTWTHVAATFSLGALRGYINGTQTLSTTLASTALSSRSNVIFGSSSATAAASNFFDGQIDEIRAWNIVRTSSQINSARTQAINPFTTGLIGYWQFDQNSDVEALYDVHGSYAPGIPGDGELNQPVLTTLVPTLTYVANAPVAAGGVNGGLPQIQPETVPPGANTDAATNLRWGSNGNRTRLYFPFDQTGSTVRDDSPFGVDGALNSPPADQSQYIGGIHGKALKFQPAPNREKNWFNPMSVPLNSKSALQDADDIAINFWAKSADFSPATAADETVFFAYHRGGGLTLTVSTDEAVGGLVVEYSVGGNIEYTVPLSDLANNSWHHFFIEIDGGTGALGTLRVWVDGSIRSDSGIVPTDPAFASVSQITLGGYFIDASGNPHNVVDGAMDDFAILQGTRQGSSEFNTADVLNMMDYGVGWAMQPLNGYQFKVNFTPTANANERLRIDALRFFDFADSTGPTEWLLTVTDASNVNTLYARIHGTTTVGEWGGQYAELRNHVFSLRGPLLFTLYGIGGTSGNWRIENVNLEGVVLNANQSPPIQANNDTVIARGNGNTTLDVLANDTVNGTTVIDPNSILLGLPDGVTAAVVSGNIRFTVDSLFGGEFDLPYLIRDASGNESGATIHVRVPDPPSTKSEKSNFTPGQTKLIPVMINDHDGAGGGLTLSIVTTGGVPVIPANVGTLTVQGNQLRFVASATAPLGTYSFAYKITDIYGREAIETNSDINIVAALQAPQTLPVQQVDADAGIALPDSPRLARASGDAIRISARPVIVATPSATNSTSLPTALATIAVGQSFFVEVWAQDLIDHVGISGGSIDLNYSTAFADATAMNRPEFSFAPVGSINDVAGLVDDFGGGTLSGGLGISPSFTRLGVVQFTAASAGTMNVSLAPGAFEFALFGVGDVPFTDVTLANTASLAITGSAAFPAPALSSGQDTGVSSSDNITRLNRPLFAGTAGTSGQTLQLIANGNVVGTTTVGAGGAYSVQPTAALTDGLYSFAVRIGTATGAPLSVTIDTVAPTASTPFWNVNLSPHQVGLTFSEVLGGTFTLADLTLQNLTTAASVAAASMSLPGSISTAYTLSFPGLANARLSDGRYLLSVPSAGVTDVAGNALAAAVAFNFVYLTGDATNDGIVGFDDLLILAQNYNQTGKSFAQGNFNYSADGKVDFDDLLLLAQKYGTTLLGSGIGSTREDRDKPTDVLDAL